MKAHLTRIPTPEGDEESKMVGGDRNDDSDEPNNLMAESLKSIRLKKSLPLSVINEESNSNFASSEVRDMVDIIPTPRRWLRKKRRDD